MNFYVIAFIINKVIKILTENFQIICAPLKRPIDNFKRSQKINRISHIYYSFYKIQVILMHNI